MKTYRILLISFCGLLILAAHPQGYGVGDMVADFKLKNFDGRTVSLSDYVDAKGVILVFDCNTCPYSKAYNDRIIALHKNYGPKGFPVVTINSNYGPGDSFEDMIAKAKSKKYEFPYLADETQQVARSFSATNTPHVFVLKRQGKNFIVSYIGAIDNNSRNGAQANKKYVEDAVNAMLEGRPVGVEKTKAVGCGIKWKDV
jgi:Peroxiredoxin